MIHGNLADLQRLLQVHPDGTGAYLGGHVPGGRSRVYGGQFLGQGLLAAAAAVPEPDRIVRSFHCYFLRPGSTDTDLRYEVTPLDPGLIEVRASQHGRLQLLLHAAFGGYTPPPDLAMPAVPPPDRCLSRAEGIAHLDTSNTDASWAAVDAPFDYRFVEDIWRDTYRAPRHHVWFRAREPRGHCELSPLLCQAATAYFADDNIMDNALFPGGWARSWSDLVTASLDHAMWFHAGFDLNDWLLFAQDSPVAAGARGFTRGLVFDRTGALVASACQEILMRTAAAGPP